MVGLCCVLTACTHKAIVVVPVVPVAPATCDTTNVSYHTDVQPVLENNCYSCHGTAQIGSGGGLDLETFSSLKNYLHYGFRGDGVYGSKLMHCIMHASLAQPMPPTYQLDTCSQMKIKRWMDEGAPEN